jgi:hypothetical protein
MRRFGIKLTELGRYLYNGDYLQFIQDVMLQALISNNPTYQTLLEQTAQQKFAEYLSQKYNLSAEFTNTTQYDPTVAYNAGSRVYLNAAAFSASNTYALGTLVTAPTGPLVNGNPTGQVYACSTAVTTPGVFNPAQWTLLGNQWTIFYAIYPFPIFDISKGWYNVGDSVWWNNHTYTALQQSVVIDHSQRIQFYKQSRIPFQNTFPDEPVNGQLWWKDNGPYIVPAGNLLTQNPATYFITTQARDNIYLKGGTQLTVGANSYTDPTWAGWDFYLEKTGYGTMVPGQDFNYTFPSAPPAATNPNLTATGFVLLGGATFLNLAQYVTHFQAIISQTAPLNPYSTLTSQQLLTTYFLQADNRNQSILQHYIAIVLYLLYRRISPKNIPDERVAGYKEAMGWLTLSMKGDIVPGLVAIQPPTGNRIRAGGNVKLQNSF